MGASPYWYFVPFEKDANAALTKLREREFAAGRYYPATQELMFPPDADSPGPGAQHDSIDEAMEDADADGTQCILDLESVGTEPDFGVAVVLDDEKLLEYFETVQPTRDDIDGTDFHWEEIERGQGICVTVYKDGKPHEYYFAGYSYD